MINLLFKVYTKLPIQFSLFVDYGNCLVEHMLVVGGFPSSTRIGIDFDVDEDVQKLLSCFDTAEKFLDDILQLKEVRFQHK